MFGQAFQQCRTFVKGELAKSWAACGACVIEHAAEIDTISRRLCNDCAGRGVPK
jgi:hypothetical protein